MLLRIQQPLFSLNGLRSSIKWPLSVSPRVWVFGGKVSKTPNTKNKPQWACFWCSGSQAAQKTGRHCRIFRARAEGEGWLAMGSQPTPETRPKVHVSGVEVGKGAM